METVPLKVLTDPAFTEDLEALDLGEIRSRRDRCSEAEVSLSYSRRVLHGRLDIVHAEQARRRGGGNDAAPLVEQLHTILADNVHAPGYGRLPQIMAPGNVGLEATRDLDAVAPIAKMGVLATVSDDELAGMESGLVELERHVSGQRRELHQIFDKLQEEVIRRYRSGEADVNDLLR